MRRDTNSACEQQFNLQFFAFPLVKTKKNIFLYKTSLSYAYKFNEINAKASFEFPATSVARSKLKFRFLEWQPCPFPVIVVCFVMLNLPTVLLMFLNKLVSCPVPNFNLQSSRGGLEDDRWGVE